MLDKLSGFWDKLKPLYDDDVIDRLNYIYTNIIILFFAVTIAAKSFVGEPLQCWVPAQFTGGWEQYVENYCFVENTWWWPMHDSLPDDVGVRESRELQYYQWVPFILGLQVLMFYFPRIVWNSLNFHTGLNIKGLIETAMLTKKDGDKKILKDTDIEGPRIANHFRKTMDFQRDGQSRHGNALTRAMSKSWGVYVTVLYLIVKLLFVINVVVQFVLLNVFLGPEYNLWGYGVLRDLANGREWETSGAFPRVTMCDVEVRQLGNLHRWSIQCVLMINMFNEKIFLFLWWWFLFVAVLTIVNFLYWLIISLVPHFGQDFVGRYLKYNGITPELKGDPDQEFERFVNSSLRKDGVTVLRLISDNCGDLVTAEIVYHLWNTRHIRPNNRPNSTKPAIVHDPNGEKVRLVDSDTSYDKSGEFQE